MRSLEANLRLYLKELGASYLFELVRMRNADGKNDKFPFFVRLIITILQMLTLTPPPMVRTVTNQPAIMSRIIR